MPLPHSRLEKAILVILTPFGDAQTEHTNPCRCCFNEAHVAQISFQILSSSLTNIH